MYMYIYICISCIYTYADMHISLYIYIDIYIYNTPVSTYIHIYIYVYVYLYIVYFCSAYSTSRLVPSSRTTPDPKKASQHHPRCLPHAQAPTSVSIPSSSSKWGSNVKRKWKGADLALARQLPLLKFLHWLPEVVNWCPPGAQGRGRAEGSRYLCISLYLSLCI